MKFLPKNTEGVLIALVCFFTSYSNAQSPHKYLRQGDAAYLSKDYKKAEGHYRDAQSAQPTYKGSYNLGNTVYMQKNYQDAIDMYERVAKGAPETDVRAKAYYNQGNAHMYNEAFDKAVESYKNSLRLNPDDAEAKKNLAFAKKMLEKQQQQQKNQEQNNQNQNNQQNQAQNNQDKQQDKQNQSPNQNPKEQNQENKDNKTPQNQQPQPNKTQEQTQNQQQPQPNNVTKENMERQLKVMDDEDRKVQQNLKKGKGKASNSAKDW